MKAILIYFALSIIHCINTQTTEAFQATSLSLGDQSVSAVTSISFSVILSTVTVKSGDTILVSILDQWSQDGKSGGVFQSTSPLTCTMTGGITVKSCVLIS